MKEYIATRQVEATPMTRGTYCEFRDWQVPEGENPDDEGYLVDQIDAGFQNHVLYKGYVSWMPKEVFEHTYRPTVSDIGELSFGQALTLLKQGRRLQRTGWNGKGMYLVLVTPQGYAAGGDVGNPLGNTKPTVLPWIGMKTADNGFVPWVASQTDMLTSDWREVV